MNNLLEEPLDVFFDRITALNGVLHVITSQSSIALSSLKRHESDNPQTLPDILHGCRILLEDIGNFPDDRWRQFHTTNYVFVIRSEGAQQAYADILERINLFIVSQAYEAYETFLLDSVAYLHWTVPATVDERKQKKWGKKNGPLSTKEQYRQYVRDTYRGKNNSKLLSWIRELASQVEEVEKHNTLTMDLRDWFAAASEVRHAATHSYGVVKTERMRNLSRQENAILRSFFPGVDEPGGYVLHLDTKSAERALKTFHNYAYAIHKSLSIEYGFSPAYATEVFP